MKRIPSATVRIPATQTANTTERETLKAEDGTVSVIFQNANDSESWHEEMLRLRQNQYSSGETVFYAVGLAHLLGEEGIIRQLQNAGYSMERVK